MELERIKELFENAKGFKSNPACAKLAEHFEGLAELHYQQKEGLMDAEYIDRFDQCFRQFWDAFDQAVESFGLSPDALKANLNNPDYFHPDQWRSMQALKQEITGEQEEAPKIKKLGRNKKNVRI